MLVGGVVVVVVGVIVVVVERTDVLFVEDEYCVYAGVMRCAEVRYMTTIFV
jgi:hypothetical protein